MIQEPIILYFCSKCKKEYGVIKYAFDNERCPNCGHNNKRKKIKES